MKTLFKTLIAGLLSFVIGLNSVFCQTPYNDYNWNSNPVFIDDFNNSSQQWGFLRDSFVDNTYKWYSFLSSTGTIHAPDFESQIYQKENVLFNTPSQGFVTLRATYNPTGYGHYTLNWDNASTSQPYYIHSGVIESVQKFKYGYFEIRCALPPQFYGCFPAFWLYGGAENRLHDTIYHEIDIFEEVLLNSNTTRDSIFSTYYYDTIFPKKNGANSAEYLQKNKHEYARHIRKSSEPPLTDFHTYAVEWSPQHIISYFDGQPFGEVHRTDSLPDIPMSIIANFAIIGTSFNNNRLNPLPSNMVIDYIKAYQLDCDCFSNVTLTSPADILNYNGSVKKKITIGTDNSNLTLNTNTYLRATDEIVFKGNVTIPVGTEFYANTHDCPCDFQIITTDF